MTGRAKKRRGKAEKGKAKKRASEQKERAEGRQERSIRRFWSEIAKKYSKKKGQERKETEGAKW